MPGHKLRAWLVANRTSVRLAFMLRMVSMAINSVMSLIWTRLLLRTMGDSLYGLFVTFQGVSRLGGLGDLGISGALILRTGQMLGAKEEEKLRTFLAASRSVFLALSLAVALVFLLLSPWLPQLLGFQRVPGAGSLPVLFATGAASVAITLLAAYFHGLNYAYGTVSWPIIPTLVVAQVGMFGHWVLALRGAPLWMQNLAYVVTGLIAAGCVWLLIKGAHPWLGEIFPLRMNRVVWRELATASGWVYLSSLGSFIYTTTDRLLINAGFGPELVPKYLLNNKLPDLAFTLIVTASFVSIPKITQWIASPDPGDRVRVVTEVTRLNLFQILLGCMAALGYLAVNDVFIRVWLGPSYFVPASWQLAFALNLAISACGDAGIQLPGRFGIEGIRKMGIAVGGTGLLNLILSFIAMKLGYVVGIAFATVLAQSVLSLVLAWQTCRRLKLSFPAWATKSWLVPVAAVGSSFALRSVLVPHSWMNIGSLLAAYAALLFLIALGLGFNRQVLAQEWRVFREMVGR